MCRWELVGSPIKVRALYNATSGALTDDLYLVLQLIWERSWSINLMLQLLRNSIRLHDLLQIKEMGYKLKINVHIQSL